MEPYRTVLAMRETDDSAVMRSRAEGLVAIALVFLGAIASALSGILTGDPVAGGLGAALLLLVIILLRDELSGVEEAHEHDARRHPPPLRAD